MQAGRSSTERRQFDLNSGDGQWAVEQKILIEYARIRRQRTGVCASHILAGRGVKEFQRANSVVWNGSDANGNINISKPWHTSIKYRKKYLKPVVP